MKKILLILLAFITLPTQIQANVDPKIFNLCISQIDFDGCVETLSKEKVEREKAESERIKLERDKAESERRKLEREKAESERIKLEQDIEYKQESEKIETDTSLGAANIAFKEHRENDALSKINYYLSKNPYSKEGYLLRALISAWDFDDPKQALQDLTKAIEIDQNFAEAYAWRAEILNYDFSNLKSAENDIQKALELSPNDPIVNFNASGVYQEKAYKNLEMRKNDNAYKNFGKSNSYIKKSIDFYPDELNNMHKRIYPFGYLYLAYYYLGLNEYDIGWFFKGQKKSTSEGKPFFESAVDSLSLAIKLAPSIDETNKLLEDYDINEVNIGEIHHWRAETYSSYLGGAWWKKSCKDWKTAKKYGYKDSFKPVREHCK